MFLVACNLCQFCSQETQLKCTLQQAQCKLGVFFSFLPRCKRKLEILLSHIELYKHLARLSLDTMRKHCPFPYLAVMLCTVLGCLCSARLNLNYRYPSWLPRLSFLQETQLGRYESLSQKCPFLHSCSIHQIIMPCRSIYQFHTPIFDPGLTVGEHLLQLQLELN